MQQELLIAVLGGLGGMLGWGCADFFAKKTIDRVGAIVSLVWAHLFGTSVLILVVLFQWIFLGKLIYTPTSPFEWAGLAFFGTLQMVVYWLVYEGFGKGQLAVLNPVFASYSGIAAFVSVMVLGEVAGASRLLTLAVIFCGVILLSVDIGGLRSKRLNIVPGLIPVATAALLASFWTLAWDKFVGGQDWLSFALFMYAFMTLAAFAVSKAKRVNLSGVAPDLWKFLAFIGLGETIAYLSISIGFSATTLTSVVALVSGAFSLPTIILAYLFLKERLTVVQTVGSLLVVTGIVILSLRF